MGGKVSFGLDEEEKVTVIEGVKLSEDVLRRMRDAQGSGSSKNSQQDAHKTSNLKPTRASTTEVQEEIRRNFEKQQALVQEQLAILAQTVGLDHPSPSVIMEKGKAWEEQEKAKMLPANLDAWSRQLERKEQELVSLSNFYKNQLEILENRNLDAYQQTTDQYKQAASKAEAKIRPRQTSMNQSVFVCADPGRPPHCALSCRPRCCSVTQRILSRLCSAPAWPNNT
ncbi:MICOS complex subunit mic25-b-like isoform X3 [Entelurus aequoreus]|uniref:MICOS complex subunit mic25-b-like isoform X3 n=1 Tax=Entelurus aequoreus TaxID=161455 RepID=UPI002B1E4E2D|nr:MICOS complex subunit mic25-b-like isoform X3 [Entelurus aequoreus]